MKKKWIITLSVLSLVLVGCAMIGPIMSNVEQPDYDVVATDGAIEQRTYAPMMIAEVTVSGEREEAISEGFRLLADYIFGNNTAQQDIAMTAPVQQEASQQIAMTAPVQQQADGNQWNVNFIMPSEYTMQTLPRPNNDQVNIREVPAKSFIVIRFAGTTSSDNVREHEKKLLNYSNLR